MYCMSKPTRQKKVNLKSSVKTYAVKHVPLRVVPVHLSLGNLTTWKIGKTRRKSKKMLDENLLPISKKVSYTFPISFSFTVIGIDNANQGKRYNRRNELHCCFLQSYNKTACPNVILTCFIGKYNYVGFFRQLEVSTYHCRIFTPRRYILCM